MGKDTRLRRNLFGSGFWSEPGSASFDRTSCVAVLRFLHLIGLPEVGYVKVLNEREAAEVGEKSNEFSPERQRVVFFFETAVLACRCKTKK